MYKSISKYITAMLVLLIFATVAQANVLAPFPKFRALDAGGDPLEETICLEGETTSVLYDDLGDYGEVDVDYTVGECPTED